MYFSFGVSIDFSFVFEAVPAALDDAALVILFTILIPIKAPVYSAVFRITLFDSVLRASVADCLA